MQTIAYIIPAFLFPAALIAYLYYFLAIGYLNASRSLRRMEANSRSPVFESFSELLSGIVTVRAFSSERRFLESFYSRIDAMNRSWWAFWVSCTRFVIGLNWLTLLSDAQSLLDVPLRRHRCLCSSCNRFAWALQHGLVEQLRWLGGYYYCLSHHFVQVSLLDCPALHATRA